MDGDNVVEVPAPGLPEQLKETLSLLQYHWYSFARTTERFSAQEVRLLLAQLESRGAVAGKGSFVFQAAARVFLLTAVEVEAPVAAHWRAAVNGLKVLRSQYAWGSKQKRVKLEAIAADPRLLRATQAAVVAGVPVPDEMLATLVLDGSEDSCDALLPHFDRAQTDPVVLARLERLERFADPKGRVWPMIELVRARRSAREAASPVFALVDQLGLERGKRFRVQIDLMAKAAKGKPNRGVTAHIFLDSDTGAPFRAWVAVTKPARAWSGRAGNGERRDELSLGDCEVASLPQWLAGAARKLGVTWRFADASTAYLRGPRLTAITRWLASG